MCQTINKPTIIDAAEVISNRLLLPGFAEMKLQLPVATSILPGQFFQLQVAEPSTILRRPFAPSQIDQDTITFVYAIVGKGTAWLSQQKRGTKLSLISPLGRGWLDVVKLEQRVMAILVGGGCGIPSLRPLAQWLNSRQCQVYAAVGARTADALVDVAALEKKVYNLQIATDDGSSGQSGNVLKALDTILNLDTVKNPVDPVFQSSKPCIFACGPTAMLRGIAKYCASEGLDCYVSLEARMACGFGACMGCVIPVRKLEENSPVYSRVCVDGPVFAASTINWDCLC